MTRPAAVPRPATISALVMLALAPVFAASCLSSAPKKPAPAPTPAPAPEVKPDPCAGIAAEQKRLEESLVGLNAEKRTLEDQVTSLKLQMLEKETMVKELGERESALEAKLDEAIQEVVRTKSKLRSLESRAEAASNLAEAEIALKTMEAQAKGGGGDRDLSQAKQLLKMSAEEFKNENYGGALYLANQAKSHLRTGEVRPTSRDKLNPVPGESPFEAPMPLELTRDGNLREGPGLEFKVVATLPKGSKIVGYSRKDRWLRVRDEKGVTGWVFQSLVSDRQAPK
jgi:hypothetical protein